MTCERCNDTGIYTPRADALDLTRRICFCPAGDRIVGHLAAIAREPGYVHPNSIHLANTSAGLAPVLRCGRRPTEVAGYIGDLRTDEFKIVGFGPQVAHRESNLPLCPECMAAMPPCARCGRPWHAHVEGLPGLCREGYAPAAAESRPPPLPPAHLLRGEVAGTVCGAAWSREGIDREDAIGVYRVDAWAMIPGLGLRSIKRDRVVCPQCANRAPDCANCGKTWRAHVAEGLKCYEPGGVEPWTKGDPAQIVGRMVRARSSEPHQIVFPSKEQEEASTRLRACGRGIGALKTIGNRLEEFRAEQALHAAAYSFVRTSEKAFTGVPGPCDAEFADALDAYARALREAVSTRGAHAESDATATTRKAVFRLWDQRHLPHFSSRGLRWFMPALRKALALTPHADLMTVVKAAEALARRVPVGTCHHCGEEIAGAAVRFDVQGLGERMAHPACARVAALAERLEAVVPGYGDALREALSPRVRAGPPPGGGA